MAFTIGPNVTVREPILSKILLRELRNACVIAPWASSEHKGEIAGKGTTVSVQIFPTITLSEGTKTGADIPEKTITITKEQLEIDTLKVHNIRVGDYEQFVSNVSYVSEILQKYKEAVAQTTDATIAAIAIAGVHSDNNIATSLLTKDNVFPTIEQMKVKLNKANAGMDRALFLSPEVASLLALSGVYDATESGKSDRENGFIRKMSSFKIFESNNLPTGKIFAMSRGAVHFVSQFINMKTTDAENAFAKKVLIEWVYGGKVFTPNKKSIVVKTYTLA